MDDLNKTISELQTQLEQKEAEFEEFQLESKEYEKELEKSLDKAEKQLAEIEQERQSTRRDLESLKERLLLSSADANKQMAQLQEEIARLSKENAEFKRDKMELELDHDVLENKHRADTSSRSDMEAEHNKLIERLALAEAELEAKKALDVTIQRLRDELRDSQNEVAVLKLAKPADMLVDSTDKRADSSAGSIKLVQDMMDSVKALELRLNNCRDIVSPLLNSTSSKR